MALTIYDTMKGQKVPFEPLHAGRVGIYVCGPTVYDMSHVGHGRVYVAFDTVVRYLRRRFDVTYVRNFTDVDDKIIKRASELGQPASAVSERDAAIAWLGTAAMVGDVLPVESPDPGRQRVEIAFDGPIEAQADLLRSMIEAGHRVVGYSQATSDLEEIFLKVTGQDAEEAA